MIAKAKSVSHGNVMLSYVTGEARSKTHPEQIFRIADNLLADNLDASSMWQMMQLATNRFKLMQNNVIRMEISPPKQYTEHFSNADWRQLWNDFVHEFDNYEKRGKDGKVVSAYTNIANSMYTVWLHKESKSGIPHLHCVACRVDKDGHTNNDHLIDLRAQWAAERVAIKRGWVTAQQTRKTHIDSVNQDCYDILRNMPTWDLRDYFNRLSSKAYKVHTHPDRNGIVHGYALLKGNAKYKASELGKGRNLTIGKLEATWAQLHKQDVERPAVERTTITTDNLHLSVHKVSATSVANSHQCDYTKPQPNFVPITIHHNERDLQLYVPKEAMDIWDEEFDSGSLVNSEDLTNLAAAMFCAILMPEPVNVASGGGTSNDLPRRNKDDDDELWAQRCAHAATRKLGKRFKFKRRR